jgi:hypothetical protein
MVKLRQLNWFEVIRAGDLLMVAGDKIMYPARFYDGWSVDMAFWFIKNNGETAIFYRQVAE